MTEIEIQQLEVINKSRGAFYTFFGKCFHEQPSDVLYNMIAEMLPHINAVATTTENDNMINAYNNVKKFIDTRNSLSGNERTEFENKQLRAYTSMFALGKGIIGDESTYKSVHKFVMQEPYSDMIVRLRKHGMELSKEFREYEDHVSVELIFLGILSYRMQELVSTDEAKYAELLEEQYNFHKDVLDTWVYIFFNDVRTKKSDEDMLYEHIATLAEEFLKEDRAFLQDEFETVN